MPTSTVSAVLKRIGLGKLSRLEPPKAGSRAAAVSSWKTVEQRLGQHEFRMA
jgi:hypothetical protein